jgi:branched-chain amino acid transport system substrate-binding protein
VECELDKGTETKEERRRWIMKKMFKVVAMVGILFSFALGANAEDTVKIGMLTTLSGPFEFVGRIYVSGAKFAVDEQNAKGGLLGKKIELIIEDDEFKADVAVRRARNLILEKQINILNGAVGSAASIALNKVADANKTILINHTATADSIQGKEFSRYGFRVITNQYSIIAALANVLGTKPYKRYYILNQDYALGRDSAAAFKTLLASRLPSTVIVGEDYHPPATKDFAPYINKIIAAKAEVIATSDFGPDFTNLVKQSRSLGLKDVKFVALWAGGDPYAMNALKDDAVGIYHANGYSMRVNTPENQKMIAAYHEQHKNDKDFQTWWPYAQIGQSILGLRMVFAAVEKAGSLDPEKIISTFEGFKYESAVGPFTMRACDHQTLMPIFVGLMEGGLNPYFNGSIRAEVNFPWEGPDIVTVPADQVALPATPAYNERCK